SAAQNLRGQVMLACEAAGFTPQVAQEAVQVQTLVSLVECGIGVALVPSICRRNASPAVAFKPVVAPAAHLAVALAAVTRPASEPQAAARFREVLMSAGA